MSGDEFEAVIAAHHEEIYRYLIRVTTRSCAADDLSQETFFCAFKAYRSLPPDANVRAWLFSIATNLCRNHFRAEKRRHLAGVYSLNRAPLRPIRSMRIISGCARLQSPRPVLSRRVLW